MPSFRVADLASLFARTFSQCALCECANNEKAKDGHENFLHSHLPVRFCFFSARHRLCSGQWQTRLHKRTPGGRLRREPSWSGVRWNEELRLTCSYSWPFKWLTSRSTPIGDRNDGRRNSEACSGSLVYWRPGAAWLVVEPHGRDSPNTNDRANHTPWNQMANLHLSHRQHFQYGNQQAQD